MQDDKVVKTIKVIDWVIKGILILGLVAIVLLIGYFAKLILPTSILLKMFFWAVLFLIFLALFIKFFVGPYFIYEIGTIKKRHEAEQTLLKETLDMKGLNPSYMAEMGFLAVFTPLVLIFSIGYFVDKIVVDIVGFNYYIRIGAMGIVMVISYSVGHPISYWLWKKLSKRRT